MGIKDLWTVLLPYCEQKPLYELHGKIVAIDLAGWVCESLCVVNYEVHPRFYLRNLYFRTCYLLLAGVTPVFVLEGKAPTLKYQVIGRRNDLQQFKGAKPKKSNPIKSSDGNNNNNNKGRTRFNYVLKQCENLLNCLGLPCVQATGEAEAYCAYLNCANLVDAVISQDSDCFAYGAEIVYRNFSISNQRSAAAQNGSVDVYNMKRIGQELHLGQQKIIAMALLCGCDYCPDGIEGVGKDTVLKLFQSYNDDEILKRLYDWRQNPREYLALEEKINNKQMCTNCGHFGKLTVHTKNGCNACNLSMGCDGTLWKDKRDAIKIELQIRKKSLLNDNFPSTEIIQEFLDKPKNFPVTLNLKWKQPNIMKFLRVIGDLLQWNEIYSFQKCLPLLTRWQCIHKMNSSSTSSLDDEPMGNAIILPKCIKKRRTLKGNSSYEIIWQEASKTNQLIDVIPQEQIDLYFNESPQNTIETLWTTIEPCNLIEMAFPRIVNEFTTNEQLKNNKKKKSTKRSKAAATTKTTTLLNGSSSFIIKKKKSKRKLANKETNKETGTAAAALNDMSGILTEIDNIDKELIIKNNKKQSKGSKNQQQKINKIDKYLIKKNSMVVEGIINNKNENEQPPPPPPQKSSPKHRTQSTTNGILNLSEFSFNFIDYDQLMEKSRLDDAAAANATPDDSFNMTKIIESMVLNGRTPRINELNGKKLRYDKIDINQNFTQGLMDDSKKIIFDEIDIGQNVAVAGGSSQPQKKTTETTSTNSTNSCSTPILISKFLNKHKIRNSLIINNENLSPIKRPIAVENDDQKKIDRNVEEINVSHFFINEIPSVDVIDEFEKSINYNTNNTIDFDELYGLT